VIATELDCQPGDEVQLLLPERALVRASLLIYGLPLLAMVLSGLLATAAVESDGLVALIASAGFVAGAAIAALCATGLEHRTMAPYIRDVRMHSKRPARSKAIIDLLDKAHEYHR
jgi:positive regulator of sigma E activity